MPRSTAVVLANIPDHTNARGQRHPRPRFGQRSEIDAPSNRPGFSGQNVNPSGFVVPPGEIRTSRLLIEVSFVGWEGG